jgi:alkanesulfonate monooxygenase SsuD/methylene tetrahydromethanopterin reductase-like flavin-dependent oxidoreductase (luciferase family)
LLAAVAGEVADGVRLHPVCNARYIDEVVLPAVAKGAARSGRALDAFEVCMKPLVATAPDAAALVKVADTVRARVAFYLSTPSYRGAFEIHGWGDVARQASDLSRAQRWDELPGLVDDEMFHTVATVGTYDAIADKLRERYEGRVDRIEFSIPVNQPDDLSTLQSLLAAIRA